MQHDEYLKLLEVAEQVHPLLKLALIVAEGTGRRLSAWRNLFWEDVDFDAGTIRWQIPFGEFPELAAKGLTNTGSDNYGGPVVTAGGLLFIAATNFDKKFRAFDKATGKLLWETTLPAAGNATPATYMLDAKQYVVIVCGGGKNGAPSGSSIVAFALPN